MKIFIKILKGAAIVISVLLLFFSGFLIYRDAESYKNVIHQDADAVVKIRVDAIGRSIFWDAIKNPSYYYNKQKERDSIEDPDKKGNGFGLPANIFLFTIKGKSVSTIFTTFNISNGEDFRGFLFSDYDMDDAYAIDEIIIAKNKDGKLMAAYTETKCVMVYNPKNESVDAIFEDILIHNKTLSDESSFLSKLKDATSHISFVTSDDQISIDFIKGEALIAGHITMKENIIATSQSNFPKFSEDSSLQFYLNGLASKKNDTINFNDFKIETDSILAYSKENLSIEIAGATSQIDTVVTYEFNDDFEKVATKTLAETLVPDITFQIAADSKKMLRYLEKMSVVENNMVNKDLFPLYQIKIDSTDYGLRGSTNLNKSFTTETISFENTFGLTIDFEKLTTQNQFPILNPYFEKLLDLNIEGSKIEEKRINVKGKLMLKNHDILAISQFF